MTPNLRLQWENFSQQWDKTRARFSHLWEESLRENCPVGVSWLSLDESERKDLAKKTREEITPVLSRLCKSTVDTWFKIAIKKSIYRCSSAQSRWDKGRFERVVEYVQDNFVDRLDKREESESLEDLYTEADAAIRETKAQKEDRRLEESKRKKAEEAAARELQAARKHQLEIDAAAAKARAEAFAAQEKLRKKEAAMSFHMSMSPRRQTEVGKMLKEITMVSGLSEADVLYAAVKQYAASVKQKTHRPTKVLAH